jgi:hypothetical protein
MNSRCMMPQRASLFTHATGYTFSLIFSFWLAVPSAHSEHGAGLCWVVLGCATLQLCWLWAAHLQQLCSVVALHVAVADTCNACCCCQHTEVHAHMLRMRVSLLHCQLQL